MKFTLQIPDNLYTEDHIDCHYCSYHFLIGEAEIVGHKFCLTERNMHLYPISKCPRCGATSTLNKPHE